jgi:hypothetical protein
MTGPSENFMRLLRQKKKWLDLGQHDPMLRVGTQRKNRNKVKYLFSAKCVLRVTDLKLTLVLVRFCGVAA